MYLAEGIYFSGTSERGLLIGVCFILSMKNLEWQENGQMPKLRWNEGVRVLPCKEGCEEPGHMPVVLGKQKGKRVLGKSKNTLLRGLLRAV